MTLEIVQSRLDRLLAGKTPKVAMLTGDWGSGKTYQWKQALERSTRKGAPPRYAYVSLFGLTSLAEVRKRLTEEVMSAIRLPGRSDTVGDAIEGGAIGLKPMQILKILPVIPYLGKLESLAQELSFATVRNAVICFDDLERAPSSLRLADVFGLASFLKEERNCRVLLISNQKKLGNDAKDEFSMYLEKVVEETVDFAPTPEEACVVALGAEPNPAGKLLAERFIRLGVSNIRVISRLGALADDLAAIVTDLHPNVLADVISTLALFGVAHFIPRKDVPTVEYLLAYGGDEWPKYFHNEKKREEQTEQEKRESDWDELIEGYGYSETSPLDKEIYAGIASGFFREEAVRTLAEDLSQRIDAGSRKASFDAALHRFWWGVGDSKKALEHLLETTMAALDQIAASQLYSVYEVLLNLQGNGAATRLLDQFIAANQNRQAALAPSEHFGEKYDATFKAVLEAEVARLKAPVDLAKTLDAIQFNRGWNPEDLTTIAEAKFEDILPLLTCANDDKLFARRLITLLKFGERGQTAEEKNVREQTIEWLKKFAETDPISALRVRRFLPEDEITATEQTVGHAALPE
ncbi:hypothetical protein [Caballeronia sp. AZ10_KS36]|uniref:hypothetical protein n=1 Tax=Caballeronia sp. AZ10_KS36 TaxID=2921757 RepID=UPI002028233D|nr:hypothetical protein [Caballeronia sp. AZ10_KS36]